MEEYTGGYVMIEIRAACSDLPFSLQSHFLVCLPEPVTLLLSSSVETLTLTRVSLSRTRTHTPCRSRSHCLSLTLFRARTLPTAVLLSLFFFFLSVPHTIQLAHTLGSLTRSLTRVCAILLAGNRSMSR